MQDYNSNKKMTIGDYISIAVGIMAASYILNCMTPTIDKLHSDLVNQVKNIEYKLTGAK